MGGFGAYILIASLTIASPGPGVVLSISNSLKYGLRGAIPGVVGLTCGMFIISLISATSIGAMLAASPPIFNVVKLIGAGYLFYLGLKFIRSSSTKINAAVTSQTASQRPFSSKFEEGLIITFSNPKPVLFFIALFPQFIDFGSSYMLQFIKLSLIFCILTLIIHSTYAFFLIPYAIESYQRGGLLP